MKSVTYSGGSHTYLFYYGADGMLAKQTVDGTETRFVRVGGLCLQERTTSNTVTNAYVWDMQSPGGIGGLLELKQGAGYYSYLFDGRGNVSALLDSNQAVKNSYKYDPFGALLYKSETVTQPYQFSTKYYYAGLALNYYGRRFYSPILGRWINRDPIEEEGGLNLYGAMGNSAVNYVDTYGLYPDLGGLVSATIAAAAITAAIAGAPLWVSVVAVAATAVTIQGWYVNHTACSTAQGIYNKGFGPGKSLNGSRIDNNNIYRNMDGFQNFTTPKPDTGKYE